MMQISEKINKLQEFIFKVENRQAKIKLVGFLSLLASSGALAGLSYGYSYYDSQADELKAQPNWNDCTADGYIITSDERCVFPTNSNVTSQFCNTLCGDISETLMARHIYFAAICGVAVMFFLSIWYCLGAPDHRNTTNINMNELNLEIQEFFNDELEIPLAGPDFANDRSLLSLLRQELQHQRTLNAGIAVTPPVMDQKVGFAAEGTVEEPAVGLTTLRRSNSSLTLLPATPRQRVATPSSPPASPSSSFR